MLNSGKRARLECSRECAGKVWEGGMVICDEGGGAGERW